MGGKGSGQPNLELRAEVKRLLAEKPAPPSFAEIGRQVGVSRERVRQLAKDMGVRTKRKGSEARK